MIVSLVISLVLILFAPDTRVVTQYEDDVEDNKITTLNNEATEEEAVNLS